MAIRGWLGWFFPVGFPIAPYLGYNAVNVPFKLWHGWCLLSLDPARYVVVARPGLFIERPGIRVEMARTYWRRALAVVDSSSSLHVPFKTRSTSAVGNSHL
jgi:hypothetical protein